MSEQKLLSCPFCGEKLENHGPRWQHPLSGSCLLSGYGILRGTREIELWNTRVPMQKILERLNNNFRKVQNDEDLEWNRAIDKAIEIVKEEGGLFDGNDL